MTDWAKVRSIITYSIIGLSVITYGLWFYYGEGGVQDANLLRDKFDHQRLEIAARELHKSELSQYLAAVERGDDAAMELAARRYGLVGENEFMWKIVTSPSEATRN